MRDAIVYSGSGWEGCNVLERLAVALRKLGSRVLYCDNPASRLKGKPPEMYEIESGIFRFRPAIVGHRLSAIRPLAAAQSRMVANQMARTAGKLSLRKPMFFYSYIGSLLPVCAEMKGKGYFLVHVCMDFPEVELRAHVSLADLTFVIPRAALDFIRAVAGDRVIRIPQLGPPERKQVGGYSEGSEPAVLREIPRPRLIYGGALQNRVVLPIVRALLRANPEWQFIHFGSADSMSSPNAHSLPWISSEELMQVMKACDVGFMPYDCSDPVQYNCVPLKLLDYFGLGMPVVSTPIASVAEFKDIVYIGGNADELTDAIECALREPADSPKRARRMEIAREHSLDNIAALLGKILPVDE